MSISEKEINVFISLNKEVDVMNEIAVSVIMPSLNVAGYIEECIASAVNQTLKELEIICVDAGSTDGTIEIIERYAKQDQRIKLVKSEIKSYGAQVNLGIKMARGCYIAILETDDYISHDMYEQLYKPAIENDCDFVKCNYYAFWTQTDGTKYTQLRRSFHENCYYWRVLDKLVPKDICIHDLYLWDGIYKKSFLLDNDIAFSETRGAAFQDVGFLFQTSILCKRVMYLDQAYYFYRTDRDGASSNSDKGLLYSFDEYNFVHSKYKALIMNDKEIARTFYCRIALAFYNSVNDPYQIFGREYKPYYQWFFREITWAVENSIISDADMNVNTPLALILKPYEEYRVNQEKRRDLIRSILGKPSEYPVVIFGCGNFGVHAYRWMKQMNYSVKAFMDNDEHKWDRTIDHIRIINPREAKKQSRETRYIVANNLYFADMKTQLMQYGVTEDHICIF